jgi:xylulokinase
MIILGVDVGTSSMKMVAYRVQESRLVAKAQYSGDYQINVYNSGLFADIEQAKWQETFISGCKALGDVIQEVDIISLSGTTPGLTAMDKEGNPLFPAILMLDQRSRKQAEHIIRVVGMKVLLEATGNMPVAGGCSLSSILWIRENHPEIFKKTYAFGHSNTFVAKWLTGKFAMDPSSASLTALYNTASNDLKWNKNIADTFGISLDQLPEIMLAYQTPGRVRGDLASDLGLKKEPNVLIGGNDAVLAAFSVGIKEPGDIINVNGTAEATLVCLPKCFSSQHYNVRVHVVPDRWLTLYVMNAGGRALEWFRTLFCRDLSVKSFYDDFIPNAVDAWLEKDIRAVYVPFLMGSRYSLEPLKAEFLALSAETSREELLAALVRGLCNYQREHLKEVALKQSLRGQIHVCGGAINPSIIKAKKKWMLDCDYLYGDASSVLGAASLGLEYLGGTP